MAEKCRLRRSHPPEVAEKYGLNCAAWMHGLDVEPASPVEVALPHDSHLRSRAGLNVHHCDVADEAVTIRDIRATNLSRTLLDLCARLSAVEALVVADMACHAGLTDKETLLRYTDDAKGRRGVARLRRLAGLAEPAESPMETRLRWLLIDAGLPIPEVQTDLYNSSGESTGRAERADRCGLPHPAVHRSRRVRTTRYGGGDRSRRSLPWR
jgi:hypothetical protein